MSNAKGCKAYTANNLLDIVCCAVACIPPDIFDVGFQVWWEGLNVPQKLARMQVVLVDCHAELSARDCKCRWLVSDEDYQEYEAHMMEAVANFIQEKMAFLCE